MTKKDEELLMQQLTNPKTQRAAFGKLVKEFSEPLYWQIRRIVLYHEDANDVMQNVFMKAWTHLDKFHQESKISTWLYRIAINESLDVLRRNKKQSNIHTDDDIMQVANRLQADQYFDGDEADALLQQAISQLPDVQKTVFNLRYFDNMKYSEISAILHTSEGSLKASYHIAVKKISEFFHKND